MATNPKDISQLSPQQMWRNFHLLTQVPRPSGHLDKIRSFLLLWSKEHGVDARQDNAGNIVMRKPATEGYEDRQTVVLQAHMDMVPQKIEASDHDFENDPIQVVIDGDWVKAQGTTLGSDDGMGLAAIMGVMEDKDLRHGPLEALVTSDEETCMYGAEHLAADTLTGDILLNIDNETLGEFVIGSAGGVNINLSLAYKPGQPQPGDKAVRVTLSGLRGGHSGLEINEGRGNANKLMARFLRRAILECGVCLASWKGGNMRNAIPRAAEATLTLAPDKLLALRQLAADLQATFASEYRGIEQGITLLVADEASLPQGLVPREIQDNLVNVVLACHDGVLRNIPSIPDVVETSSNLGIVNVAEGRADLLILARSSSPTMMHYLEEMQAACASMAGMRVELTGRYGAWQPNFDSPITALMVEVYNKLYPDEPASVQVCHAGLECSLIGDKYPGMDLVSCGPTLRSPHTPDERCHIPSVGKFWDFLTRLLEAIPPKH